MLLYHLDVVSYSTLGKYKPDSIRLVPLRSITSEINSSIKEMERIQIDERRNSGKWYKSWAGKVILNGTTRFTIVKKEKQDDAIYPECWETKLAWERAAHLLPVRYCARCSTDTSDWSLTTSKSEARDWEQYPLGGKGRGNFLSQFQSHKAQGE